MTSRYPSRPPFPKSPTVSLEGAQQPERAQRHIRTYPFKVYETAESLLKSYCQETLDGEYESGTCFGIKGAHGSGKTHLIFHLIGMATQLSPSINQTYVKAESGDFLNLYQRTIASLGIETLKKTYLNFLHKIVTRELDMRNHKSKLLVELGAGPESIAEMMESHLVSPSEIAAVQRKILRGRHPKYDPYLQVLPYIVHPELNENAFDWLQGGKLDPTILDRLGLSDNLDTKLGTDTGLHFLATLFGNSGNPFALYLDQIERLVLDAETEIREANKGRLHTLVEIIIRNGGLLVISAVTKAWDAMTVDFIQRLSMPPLVMPQLEKEGGLNLVKVYVSKTKEFSPYSKEEEIFPFSEEAVGEMVNITNGNVRSMLQLGYRSFELASEKQEQIEAHHVQRAIQMVDMVYERDAILSKIKAMLTDRGIDYLEHPPLSSGYRPDLVVPNINVPKFFVEIAEPIFEEDEVKDAIRFTNWAKIVHEEYPGAKLVLVEAGYASDEVRQRLKSLVNEYIIYSGEAFSSLFAQVIDRLMEKVEIEESAKNVVAGEDAIQKIDQLGRELHTLMTDRYQETRHLEARLEDLVKYLEYSKAPKPTARSLFEKFSFMWIALLLATAVIAGIFLWKLSLDKQEQAQKVSRALSALENYQTNYGKTKASVDDAITAFLYKYYDGEPSRWHRQSRDSKENYHSLEDYLSTRIKSELLSELKIGINTLSLCVTSGACDQETVCLGLGRDLNNLAYAYYHLEDTRQSYLEWADTTAIGRLEQVCNQYWPHPFDK